MSEETLISQNDAKLTGLNTQYANANKWIGYFPLANIFGNETGNLELNLTKFTIPQMNIGSTSISFKGYQYEIPTKLVNADTKEITFEYIIKEDWSDYKALYSWAADVGLFVPTTADAIAAQADGKSSKVTTGVYQDYINCRVWLLDNYKRRIIDFVFYDSWIKNFADLQLDVSNADEIHHSVTLAYSRFEIADAKKRIG